MSTWIPCRAADSQEQYTLDLELPTGCDLKPTHVYLTIQRKYHQMNGRAVANHTTGTSFLICEVFSDYFSSAGIVHKDGEIAVESLWHVPTQVLLN